MIFGEELVIFIYQNQDFQDLKIFRMLLDDFWWGVGDFYLSDSEAWRSHIRISRMWV